jgi:hypothetical protein
VLSQASGCGLRKPITSFKNVVGREPLTIHPTTYSRPPVKPARRKPATTYWPRRMRLQINPVRLVLDHQRDLSLIDFEVVGGDPPSGRAVRQREGTGSGSTASTGNSISACASNSMTEFRCGSRS